MPEIRHLHGHRRVRQRRRTQEFHGLGLQLPNTSCCRLASYEFEVPGPRQPPWLNRREEPDGSLSHRRLAQGRRRRSSSLRECIACIGATSSILSHLRPDSGGKIFEEIVGGLLCHAIDEALSELGELAADLRFDVVGQQSATILVGE